MPVCRRQGERIQTAEDNLENFPGMRCVIQAACPDLFLLPSSRVHSGIRVHLTLHGRNSLYVYPIGTKYTSNAFFFHFEDVKILLCHSSSVVVNWQPPPPLQQLIDSEVRVSCGFPLLWHAFTVRPQTRTPMIACDKVIIFSKKATMERVQDEFCPGTISRRHTRSRQSQYFPCHTYRYPLPPEKPDS